ncbi:MAG TPA: hypothetical protein VFQ92_19940, partial [Blastocatellia bacterium]|nr:hypothetical protein [Blastocatellia bacterium]
MSPQLNSVNDLIGTIRKRINVRRLSKGTAITVAVTVGSLLIAGLAATQLNPRPAVMFTLRILPLLLAGAALWLFIFRPLRRKVSDLQIARLIEEKSGLEDRLVTAVEYAEDNRAASPVIISRLITDAGERSAGLDLNRIIDRRPSYVYGGAAAVVLLAFLALVLMRQTPVSSGMAALYSPEGGDVLASSMFINVSPGTARAPRGSDQKIKATLQGFNAEMAQVFVRRLDASNWVATPMEPAKKDGEFQHVIFNIQDSVSYYVEANGVRSPEFTLEVADLPFVKQIDLVLNFPAYTRLASKKIENGGEVASLKGTVVTVIAKLSADAKAARILLNNGAKIDMVAADDGSFSGQFTVKENGTYKIELTAEEGPPYNGSNEYDITVLEDLPPSVSIDKPGRDMKVTSL